jgi:MraZ protein
VENSFRSAHQSKVDGKGRVSIPVRFRRVLEVCDARYSPETGARLFIVFGDPTTPHLIGLTGDAYDDITTQINALPRGSAKRKLLSKIYFGKCLEMVLDDTGRIVLPPALRAKIGLEDEAYFLGDGERFLIMTPEAAEEEDASIDALYAELGQGDPFFDPLSLLEDAGPGRSADEAG